MSIDALPSELLVAPQPLIGFCGLDVTRNSVHKAIWDAFSTNRKSDRAAVQFKLLSPNYEFPVAKPKRSSYEWYHPKGILKRNWMLKHLHVLPAVVVLFQEIEWNDAQWTEKQVQCAATLQALKNALQERNTRICLVLLQRAAPLPPGEDLLASERAASLTTACGINSKMLFILPYTEHLMGYTLRLESAFLDMAQSYYALMSKGIRTHRDQLTAAHVTLKIRHQFKLGFIAEMRQDLSTALKHYTQAYANLEEIRITDTNCLEIKTIAGFLNYKICRLMFKLKVPRDAINHFISHIDKYKSRIGFKDLIFEHYAWLSTQHSMFAELFCEAIKNGLPALQTQHPGIYFHKAAEYIIKRREAFQQSCAASLSPTEPTTPTTLQNNSMSLFTEYFGIRAVKTGEPASEQQLNSFIRETERNFNHSNAIINLLSQAMGQFKIFKCLRFRKKLAIDMAEEYFKSGDHDKALTLYSLMLPDYRQDKWPTIFSDVLLKTLRCALLSASVTDYICCSLETLSLRISHDQRDRILVLENLWKVFQGVPPISPNQFSPEVRDLWENALLSVKAPIPVDLDKLVDLLSMCVTFEKVELKNNEVIILYLIVKQCTDVPLKVRNFAVLLTDGTSTYKMQASKYITFSNIQELSEHHQNDNTPASSATGYVNVESDLKLEPDTYYQFQYRMEAQQFLENTQLRVTRIETQMGTDKLSALLAQSNVFERNLFHHHNRYRDLDDNITINSMCYITPTFHLVTQSNLDTESTMLINEYYAVVTTISNPHNIFLQNVGLNISIPVNLRNKVFLATDVSPSRQKLHAQIQIDIGELSMQSSNTVSYYVFSLIETNITLQQKIWYSMDVLPRKLSNSTSVVLVENVTPNSVENSPENAKSLVNAVPVINAMQVQLPIQIEYIDEHRLRKTCETTLSVVCVPEFKFIGRYYTLSREELTHIYRGENFLFRANIEVQSPVPLDVLETYLICDHNLVQSTYSFKRKKYTKTYEQEEQLEDVIVLRANATLDDWVTAKEFERNKNAPQSQIFSRLHTSRKNEFLANTSKSVSAAAANAQMNKNLMAKIPNNMTVIGNAANISSMLMTSSQNSNMSSSTISDDGKATQSTFDSEAHNENSATTQKISQGTRLVYNKAMDAMLATGHCRGFLKSSLITEPQNLQPPQQEQQIQAQKRQVFGMYCIKWRRSGSDTENESKFVIHGRPIEEPPINIYCTIEERMFVKMPMIFKVVLKNPTCKVLHLIATLSVSNTDNFICSGHKQLDISLSAYGEKDLVYNLYPLCVGWQNLPELTLEYNSQVDASKGEPQNNILRELIQRSMPKKVFVLPPLKQQTK